MCIFVYVLEMEVTEPTDKQRIPCNCEIGLTNLFQLLKVARLFVTRHPLRYHKQSRFILSVCTLVAVCQSIEYFKPFRSLMRLELEEKTERERQVAISHGNTHAE